MRRSRRSTTRWQHLYDDPRWRKASAEFRRTHPRCADCGEPTRIVDHSVPHNGDPALFWDRKNWAPRCWSCHSAKSRVDQVKERTGRTIYRRGADVHGIPLDPRHPWRQAAK